MSESRTENQDADRVIELSPEGTFKCPHCQRPTPHEHIVDRKGYVHDC